MIWRLSQPVGIPRVVRQLLAGHDPALFVSTSDYEGFGLAVAEAMAADRPVVATAVRGHFDLVEEGGFLVEATLCDRWTLLLAGDGRNLRRVTAGVDQVDLFHYDSDKSYRGRSRALRLLTEKLDDESVIVMDDVREQLLLPRRIDGITPKSRLRVRRQIPRRSRPARARVTHDPSAASAPRPQTLIACRAFRTALANRGCRPPSRRGR
jgi:Glycosyl transferases group 1